MLKESVIPAAALLLFQISIFVTGYIDVDGDSRVLVDDKCKCIKVTSSFVPSKDNPNDMVLERRIAIKIPLGARENISDPTSPIRTHFVYNLSKLCKKCNPEEVDISGDTIPVDQDMCPVDPQDTCYTYNRNKCYTSNVSFNKDGKTVVKKVALTPDSCHGLDEHDV